MRTALKWISLAICLLAGTSSLAGEHCEAAKATFASVAYGYACRYEIWRAGWVNCESDAEGMKKLWELTDSCATATVRSGDASTRIRLLRDERLEVRRALDPLLAARVSAAAFAAGIVPLAAGGVMLLGTLIGTMPPFSFSLYGGSGSQSWRPLNSVTTPLLVGGAIAVVVGAVVMLAVAILRDPYNAPIRRLEDQLNDVEGELDAEQTDESRLVQLRRASSQATPPIPDRLPPLPPLSVAFTLARF